MTVRKTEAETRRKVYLYGRKERNLVNTKLDGAHETRITDV